MKMSNKGLKDIWIDFIKIWNKVSADLPPPQNAPPTSLPKWVQICPQLICPLQQIWPPPNFEPVDPQSLWIHRAHGSAESVDLWSLWIRRACGSVEPVDLWSLWICGVCGSVEPCGSAEPCGSVEPVDPWSLVDLQSLWICGALWIHGALWIRGACGFSNMILANEHRSLGPIFCNMCPFYTQKCNVCTDTNSDKSCTNTNSDKSNLNTTPQPVKIGTTAHTFKKWKDNQNVKLYLHIHTYKTEKIR